MVVVTQEVRNVLAMKELQNVNHLGKYFFELWVNVEGLCIRREA
jgi:hypothetical protein